MRRIILSLFWLTCSISIVSGQNYAERVQQNLSFLVKDSSVLNMLTVDSLGVSMFASPEDKSTRAPEITVVWEDAGEFLKIMNNFPTREVYEIYTKREVSSSLPIHRALETTGQQQGLEGVRIALDPGHFAGNIRQARQEERIMDMNGSEYGVKKRIRFYEADLAYSTALILKKQLEDVGAEVLISRLQGRPALGLKFRKWYRKEFRTFLVNDLACGEMDLETYNWWKNEATKKQVFRSYFKRKDFEARAKKINAWKPDITFIIHYNAEPSEKLQAHERNYCMAFVGGGFSTGELNSPEDRIEFLRLLLSDELEHSIELSSFWVEAHQDILKVPAVSEPNDLFYLRKYSVYTGEPGVYSRNLALTRTIHGTICYGESLLQENIFEAPQLAKKDYRDGKIKTSKRVMEVAQAYYRATLKYFDSPQ